MSITSIFNAVFRHLAVIPNFPQDLIIDSLFEDADKAHRTRKYREAYDTYQKILSIFSATYLLLEPQEKHHLSLYQIGLLYLQHPDEVPNTGNKHSLEISLDYAKKSADAGGPSGARETAYSLLCCKETIQKKPLTDSDYRAAARYALQGYLGFQYDSSKINNVHFYDTQSINAFFDALRTIPPVTMVYATKRKSAGNQTHALLAFMQNVQNFPSITKIDTGNLKPGADDDSEYLEILKILAESPHLTSITAQWNLSPERMRALIEVLKLTPNITHFNMEVSNMPGLADKIFKQIKEHLGFKLKSPPVRRSIMQKINDARAERGWSSLQMPANESLLGLIVYQFNPNGIQRKGMNRQEEGFFAKKVQQLPKSLRPKLEKPSSGFQLKRLTS